MTERASTPAAAKDGESLLASDLSWGDQLFAMRDRLYASSRFQRFAATFWLTRPIARQQARATFDLCAGFVYSQVLFACVELGVFETLSEKPCTAEQLSMRLGLPMPSVERLLCAAASLRLVGKRRGGRWGLGATGAAVIGNPGLTCMIRHHALLYADLRDPVSLLRGQGSSSALSSYWPYAKSQLPQHLGPAQVHAYTDLMAASQAMISSDIIDAYPFHRHQRLLDVGGGAGAFLSAVGTRVPGLQLSLFDLPAVAERARLSLAAAGLEGRTQLHGGNFFEDQLPAGTDVISLVRIVHDHDDDNALKLLRNIHRALPGGGTLLVAEPMSGTRGAEAITDAYFGFYLLAMGSGRTRTPTELMQLLRCAGFSSARLVPTARPMLVRLVVARA